jgi:Tol biopolymer transport system component
MTRTLAVVLGALAVVAVAVAVAAVVSQGSGASVPAQIAYVTGGSIASAQVWLADAGGGRRHHLGNGTNPLLSPDGRLVAASSGAASVTALSVFWASGGAPRRFFTAARVTARPVAFSPDSRYLAVVLASTDPGSDAASGLAVIDTRSDSVKLIAQGTIYGASFAPDQSDRIAYAAAPSTAVNANADIHITGAGGAGSRSLTHDGRSLYPSWGPSGIAFARERLRAGEEPAYQVWLMGADGSHPAQLTHLPVPPAMDGLAPIASAATGGHLVAEYVGENTSQAWTIDLATGRAQRLGSGGPAITGAAISRDGASVLVDRGGLFNAPSQGRIESIPFSGGAARVLAAHGADPSWNL